MRKQKLWASDIVFAEDNIFFSSGQFNGLFKAGLQGGEAEFINFFPYDSKLQSRLHGDAFKYNDEILFLPDLSEYITLYSIKNNNFVCMKFPVENKNPAMKYWPQVVGGIMIDSRVYAFGAKYPCVVCYDFETRKLETYDIGTEQFEMREYSGQMPFFSRDIYLMEDSIFVRGLTSEVIVEFNLNVKKFFLHRMGTQLSCGTDENGEKIWVLQERRNTICAWNRYGGMQQIIKVDNEAEKVTQNWQCSILYKNEIWIFPYLPGVIVNVNTQSGKIKAMDLFKNSMVEEYKNDVLGAVWFRKIYKNKLYFMSVLENILYCFDGDQEKFRTDFYADRNRIIKLLFGSNGYSQGLIDRKQTLWKIDYDIIDAAMLNDNCRADGKGEDTEIGNAIYRCTSF